MSTFQAALFGFSVCLNVSLGVLAMAACACVKDQIEKNKRRDKHDG